MKITINIILACVLLCSCQKEDHSAASETAQPERDVSANSRGLAGNFPLLPLIEKRLWQELLMAEKVAGDPQATESARAEAAEHIHKITARLQQKHPFRSGQNRITLGGISYDKQTGKIHIPAVVQYPEGSDQRHPGELELILCSARGRSHETLFMSEARPLHLEILMHLAGYQKTSPMSLFRVDVIPPEHPPIRIESMIEPAGSEALPEELLWEFSGSDFNDLYSPDQTGDFIMLWQAHDSVLSVRHEKIASGEMKLLPHKHSSLPNGTPVNLSLSPVGH